MKKHLFTLVIIVIFISSSLSAKEPRHTIMFYNVENLFDTIMSVSKSDRHFTPKGKNHWDSQKYYAKLANIEDVISDIAAVNKGYPTVIGLAEVESSSVLKDLATSNKLIGAEYSAIHYDSSDERGIDVAFLYRADKFTLHGSLPVKPNIPFDKDYKTRDILTMWGVIDSEEFFFIVAHCPSRLGGKSESAPYRDAIGASMRSIVDSVRTLNPLTRFVIMGDFNDDPNDESIAQVLGAKGNAAITADCELYTPFYSMLMAGYGTLAYKGVWSIFDMIIVSGNLLNGGVGLQLQPSIYNSAFYGNIFKPSYLIEQNGHFRGYPRRSWVSGKFTGGYSDHLPVFINLE